MTNQTKQEVTLNDLKQAIINEIYDLLNDGYFLEKAEVVNHFIDALMKLNNISVFNNETKVNIDIDKTVETIVKHLNKNKGVSI